MKFKLLILILSLLLGFSLKVFAQQVVSICYQVPGTTVPYCVPVSSSSPLPVYVPSGH